MDVAAPHSVTTTVEWRRLRPWNLAGNVRAARCHPSKWPFALIVVLTIIRPPFISNTDPGVVVNFTRPVPRPISVTLIAMFFVLCATAPAVFTIAVGWWAGAIVVAAIFVTAIRLNVPTLGAFQGTPATVLLLHDFTAAERGTGVPEHALGELLANYNEPIKLTVKANRDGLVRMYTRLGFVPDLEIKGGMLVMIRPVPLRLSD